MQDDLRKKYEKVIRFEIRKQLARGCSKFVLFPFGEIGKIVKKILNEEFGLNEELLIDNIVQEVNVFPMEYLCDKKWEENECLLICSDREDIYGELREKVADIVPAYNIYDLFPKVNFHSETYMNYVISKRDFDVCDCIFNLDSYGVKFYLPFWQTDLIQRNILFSGTYYEAAELFFITHMFKGVDLKGKIILDVGANIGNHSIYYIKECGAKRVYALEPVMETFNILKHNIVINEMQDTIIPFNLGAGEKRTKSFIKGNYNLSNIGGTALEENSGGNIEIVPIDELKLEDISFIKIDVEGFEDRVIRGALDTIRKSFPVIVVESWDADETIFDIIAMLCPLGYQFVKMGESPNYLFYCR